MDQGTEPPPTDGATTVGAAGSATVAGLIERAAVADGISPLSDQISADLRAGIGTTVVARRRGLLVGFAHVAPHAGGWTMQVVVDPASRRDPTVAPELLGAAVTIVANEGGGRVDWWVFDAREADDALAAAAGFAVGRDLLQMHRSLPADRSSSVTTRSFRVGEDEDRWLAVNNRAFAGHPEQGGWDRATLALRMAEPWFDPDGFRLHEVDDRIAAFCWTKIHAGPPEEGEIYVIGVDPDFQGRRLGRELTLAGLDAIVRRGVDRALLYVDGANAAAVGLYRRLGFTITRTDRSYTIDVAPSRSAPVATRLSG